MKTRLAARNINLLKKGLCYTLERNEGGPKLATWEIAPPPMLCLVLLSTVTPTQSSVWKCHTLATAMSIRF